MVKEVMQKEESYELPEAARNNAQQVLDWKDEHGDEVKGMTDTGWSRARQLAGNKTVSGETVQAMAQFNRHRKNSKIGSEHEGTPWKDAGYVAWLGWGGDTGIDWAIRQSEQMEKSDQPKVDDFKVIKIDEDQRIVFGWASVSTFKGELVVDRQGDVIRTETLHKAANEFMEDVRVGKLMHEGEQVGQIVHSFPISDEICKALGIQSDMEGWITGYKVYDEDLWQDVKSGRYGAFSIGGAAQKEEFIAN